VVWLAVAIYVAKTGYIVGLHFRVTVNQDLPLAGLLCFFLFSNVWLDCSHRGWGSFALEKKVGHEASQARAVPVCPKVL